MPRAPYFYPAAGSAAEAVSEQHSGAPARDDLAGNQSMFMTGNEESFYSPLQDHRVVMLHRRFRVTEFT